jgi:hypothetical protein
MGGISSATPGGLLELERADRSRRRTPRVAAPVPGRNSAATACWMGSVLNVTGTMRGR